MRPGNGLDQRLSGSRQGAGLSPPLPSLHSCTQPVVLAVLAVEGEEDPCWEGPSVFLLPAPLQVSARQELSSADSKMEH